MAIPIPAYCPECGTFFASRSIVLGDSASVEFKDCWVGPCPNGHMGIILNGTYKVLDGILRILHGEYGSIQNLEEIRSIAREAEYGLSDPDDALDNIAGFLPPESAAAIKQLGREHPLTAILLIITIISMIAGTITSITQAVRSILPPDPMPQIIINNTNTIINPPAPTSRGRCAVPNPADKGTVRRRKKMEKQKKKTPRKRNSNPTYEI